MGVLNIKDKNEVLNTYIENDTLYSSVNIELDDHDVSDFFSYDNITLLNWNDTIKISGYNLVSHIVSRKNEYGSGANNR